MKGLMTYGLVTETKKIPVEYSIDGPDGKTYAIVREGTKYHIKNAPKGSALVTESFDYIGGFMNRKQNEYHSYNEALKHLELKMRSLNEAYGVKTTVETLNPDKKGEVIVEMTDAMKSSLARYRQIMNNTSSILKENSTIGMNNTGVPEAPKTTSFSAKLGEPFTDKAEATLDKDFKATASDPEKQGEPFGDNEKAEQYTDAKYVPAGSVANQKPTGGKVVRVNEGNCVKEECFEVTIEPCDELACGLPSEPGIGEVGPSDPFGMNVNEDTEVPGGFDAVAENEGEEDIDLDDLDTDVEDVEAEEDPLADEELDDDTKDFDTDELGDEEDIEDGIEGEDLDVEDDEDYATEESVDELKAEIEELRSIIEDLIEDDDDEDVDLEGDEDADLEGVEADVEDGEYDEELPEEGEEEEFEIDGASEDELDPEQYAESIVRSAYNMIAEDTRYGDEPDIKLSDIKKGQFMKNIVDHLSEIEGLDTRLKNAVMDYAVEASRLIEDVITRQRQKKDETMTPEELKQQEDANAEVMREHYTALTGILDAVVQTFGESHPVTEDFRQMANYVFRVNDTRGYYVPQGADGKYMRNSVSRDYKNPGERDINYLLDIIKKYNVFFRSLNEALNNEYNITDEEIEMTNMWAKQFVAGSKKFVEALQNHDVDNAKIIYRQNILHYFRKIKEKFQGGAVVDAFKVLFRPHREIMHTIKENPSFLDNIRQPEQPQEQPEETVVPESYRRSGRMIREEGTKLNVFGHHPGYRKKPMTLPQTGSDRDGNYRDWNDESVYSEEPFGKEIGSSEPFEARISKTVDMVMESLKKKLS
jgi:hypothetical protein